MKTLSSHKFQQLAAEIISLFFIILFIYAAFSKLLNHEVFKTQLSQSPFIDQIASLVAWGIPVLLLCIAGLLFFRGLKLAGMYAALVLMLLFSLYIFAVINFASSIPCSCNGIIASLSWNEHLIFNVACIILAALGIVIKRDNSNRRKNKKHQFSGYQSV